MKFAHFADCHLGAWRQPELQHLNLLAFKKVIEICIKEKVDFVLIAGDLFDQALPQIELLKEVVSEFRLLKEAGIPCYLIPGSHDWSVSGKTFLDVLEKAGLCVNVAKFEETEEGIKLKFTETPNLLLAGLPGKKAGLEQELFKKLHAKVPASNKLKIFLVHTSIAEAKPEELLFECIKLNALPKGFDYYAAGHLHLTSKPEHEFGSGILAYPGPLWPNSVDELEQLGKGTFYLIETEGNKLKLEKKNLKLKESITVKVNVDNMTAQEAQQKILQQLEQHELKNKIVILKVQGKLKSGKRTDLDFEAIQQKASDAYVLLKNFSKFTSPEIELALPQEANDLEQIEQTVLEEYQKAYPSKFNSFIKPLLSSLNLEWSVDEKKEHFENRVVEIAKSLLLK